MRDMTRELLIRASRPLHMTRAYQTPRFDPRILRSSIFPREFTPMGADPDPYLPFSILFFLFLLSSFARWMEQKKEKKKKEKLSTNRPRRISPLFKERLSFGAGNGEDDFLMGNFWGVLYDRNDGDRCPSCGVI